MSFPSTNPSRTDAQRGAGAADAGIAMLRRLNAAGYGTQGSGLELDIVSNPVGAFLPAPRWLAAVAGDVAWGTTGDTLADLLRDAPVARYWVSSFSD